MGMLRRAQQWWRQRQARKQMTSLQALWTLSKAPIVETHRQPAAPVSRRTVARSSSTCAWICAIRFIWISRSL